MSGMNDEAPSNAAHWHKVAAEATEQAAELLARAQRAERALRRMVDAAPADVGGRWQCVLSEARTLLNEVEV